MKALIIGAGFAGAVTARQLAEKGYEVTVLEKRNHIAGNCYDEYDEYGVLVHKYGPHIFHTNIEQVYDYLSLFTEWYNYSHEVVGNVYGKIIPIPFNLNTLKIVFGEEKGAKLEKELIDTYGLGARVPILELRKSESRGIKEIAEYVYENIFLKYTMKQWEQSPEEVDQSVTARVPVLISYDNRYFQDKYQGMPLNGYTPIFEKMLNHKNITVETSVDAKDRLIFDFENQTIYYNGEKFDGKVIFTGAIDEFFDYKCGKLPYRSLRFDFEHYDTDYQGHGVVNYTVSEAYTRITEFKYLTGQKIDGTTIIKEYPQKYTDNKTQVPYYAILSDENRAIHNKYAELVAPFGNFYLLGRLAEYKYYNIDGIVKAALDLSEKITEE